MQPNNQPDVPDVADLAPDPADPVQGLDDAGGFSIEELGVDAQPEAEGRADIDAAIDEDDREEDEEENDADLELDTPESTTSDAMAAAQGKKDTGDLYGMHTPPAGDPEFDPSVQSQTDTGENWLEALEADSTENGAAPEHILDVTEEVDPDGETRHNTDSKDRPVADKGSGGPAGL